MIGVQGGGRLSSPGAFDLSSPLDAVRQAMKSDAALNNHSTKFILARAYSLYIALRNIKSNSENSSILGGGGARYGLVQVPGSKLGRDKD